MKTIEDKALMRIYRKDLTIPFLQNGVDKHHVFLLVVGLNLKIFSVSIFGYGLSDFLDSPLDNLTFLRLPKEDGILLIFLLFFLFQFVHKAHFLSPPFCFKNLF
jgi:hypothetical protein